MHELSVAMALHRACREEAQGPDERIVLVRVQIGELAGVEPDLLEFAWSACIQDSGDEGARLEIEYLAAKQVCARCGPIEERQPGTWLRLCPYCEDPLRVEGGDELDIVALSFEEAALTEQKS